MKKFVTNAVVALLFLFAIFIVVSSTQVSNSKKQVMLIKTFLSIEPEGIGIAIIQNNEPTEFISIDNEAMYGNLEEGEDVMKKVTETNGKIFLSTLQKFYDKGWELKGIEGGDFPTYILVK